MKVWVLQRECGDYYCGCGGGHIVGVFLNEEDASRAGGGDLVFEKVTPIEVGETRWYDQPRATGDTAKAWT
jgi:hypothetical protein